MKTENKQNQNKKETNMHELIKVERQMKRSRKLIAFIQKAEKIVGNSLIVIMFILIIAVIIAQIAMYFSF